MTTLRFRLAAGLCVLAAAVAGLSSARPADDKPIRALLVIGGCCHDYAKQKDILTRGVSARANVQWAVSYDPDKGTKHLNPVYEKDDWAKGFDVIVHDECTSDVKDLKVIDRVLKPHRDGLPAVVLHCGMHSYRSEGFPKTTPWFEFTGLASTGHGPQAPIEITLTDKESPITKGMQGWKTINEELYNNSAGKLHETAQPLARGKQTYKTKDGKERTDDCVVAWTNKYNGKTNVFATTLGHNNETVADPRYLDLVTRGLLWSVGKLDEAHLKPAQKVMIDDAGK
jgi:type 1 glutamine amidotransferase